jgi:uncharacterized membrane protein
MSKRATRGRLGESARSATGPGGAAPIHHEITRRSLNRIASLSDGVFSIAMTLIVFQISAPAPATVHSEAELWHALGKLAPSIVTYLMSFLTLGIFWHGQQAQFNHLEHGDRELAWIHLTYLAVVAILPFSTLLLAKFITYRIALLIYWFNTLLLGGVLFVAWWYAVRAGLTKADVTPEVARAVERRLAFAQLLFAIAAAVCVINTSWSIASIVVVQLGIVFQRPIRFSARLATRG